MTGALTGAALFAIAEAARPRGGGAGRLLDWAHVTRIANSHLPAGGELTPEAAAGATALYRRLAAEVEGPLLETLGGLPAGAVLPDFDVLGRRGWVELNVGILRRAIDPALEGSLGPVPDSLLVDLGRAGLDRYLGLLLAHLAGRVLGQFDPQLLGKEPVGGDLRDGVYLVEPNVAAWEARDGLPPDQLRTWLILHETTHAWQFAAHPWLKDHLNAALGELLAIGRGARRDPLSRLLRMTVGLRSQWRVARRLQAAMSLVEGHSNLAMNLAGRRLLPDFERLHAAHRRRSRERSLLEVLLSRVTGLEMKMRQYEVGERFCREVAEAHGMSALDRAWSGPGALPTLEELEEPEAWYRRVAGRSPGPRR